MVYDLERVSIFVFACKVIIFIYTSNEIIPFIGYIYASKGIYYIVISVYYRILYVPFKIVNSSSLHISDGLQPTFINLQRLDKLYVL